MRQSAVGIDHMSAATAWDHNTVRHVPCRLWTEMVVVQMRWRWDLAAANHVNHHCQSCKSSPTQEGQLCRSCEPAAAWPATLTERRGRRLWRLKDDRASVCALWLLADEVETAGARVRLPAAHTLACQRLVVCGDLHGLVGAVADVLRQASRGPRSPGGS